MDQALSANEDITQDNYEGNNFAIEIMHRIGLVYRSIGDRNKSIDAVDTMRNILKSNRYIDVDDNQFSYREQSNLAPTA